jgi:hypothetical protein
MILPVAAAIGTQYDLAGVISERGVTGDSIPFEKVSRARWLVNQDVGRLRRETCQIPASRNWAGQKAS